MKSAREIIMQPNDSVKTLNQDLLDEIRNRLLTEFKPTRIIIFGSHAWGKPDADSDVDILVIVPDRNIRHARFASRAHRALGGLGISKDIIVRTEAEIQEASLVPASIENKITKEGIILHG